MAILRIFLLLGWLVMPVVSWRAVRQTPLQLAAILFFRHRETYLACPVQHRLPDPTVFVRGLGHVARNFAVSGSPLRFHCIFLGASFGIPYLLAALCRSGSDTRRILLGQHAWAAPANPGQGIRDRAAHIENAGLIRRSVRSLVRGAVSARLRNAAQADLLPDSRIVCRRRDRLAPAGRRRRVENLVGRPRRRRCAGVFRRQRRGRWRQRGNAEEPVARLQSFSGQLSRLWRQQRVGDRKNPLCRRIAGCRLRCRAPSEYRGNGTQPGLRRGQLCRSKPPLGKGHPGDPV